jgi:hypothetical protein
MPRLSPCSFVMALLLRSVWTALRPGVPVMQDPKGSAMHHINTSQPETARLWQVHCADTYRERSMGIACRHAQQAAQKAAQHSTASAVRQ